MQALIKTVYWLMKSIRLLLILLFACVMEKPLFAEPENNKCLSIASNPKKLKLVAAIQEDVKKVFEKSEICASYINFPLKRMQTKMKQGEIDGEFLRIGKYIRAMKDYVIPVPTPIISVTGVLVTLSKGSLRPKTLNDIVPYRVGIMHGTVWQQNAVKNNAAITKGYSYTDLAKKLKQGEVETFLIEELALTTLVKNNSLNASDIYVSPVVVDHPTYLLMHKKHKNLIGKLDSMVKKMKAEGAFQIERCCN